MDGDHGCISCKLFQGHIVGGQLGPGSAGTWSRNLSWSLSRRTFFARLLQVDKDMRIIHKLSPLQDIEQELQCAHVHTSVLESGRVLTLRRRPCHVQCSRSPASASTLANCYCVTHITSCSIHHVQHRDVRSDAPPCYKCRQAAQMLSSLQAPQTCWVFAIPLPPSRGQQDHLQTS